MKNDNLFPLERNNYFFGKLMTSREFETEQTYGNNKRRLLSFSLLNPGVVCGLTVTKADGTTIAVESGFALDGLGRELTLSELKLILLSELDGFNDDRGHSGFVYLCAEYSELQVEPVHALGDDTGSRKYSRVRETVRLFLRYGEPEPFEIERLNFEDSRNESLQNKLERRARITLFLARIYLVRWEEAYEIDKIEQVPFDQYAVEFTHGGSGHGILEKTRQADKAERNSAIAIMPAVSFGTAEVKILDGAKQGSVYYSDDIPHGLGLVPAAVTLGTANIDGAVFGDPSVFGGDPSYTYAVCVSNNNGTFKIGVRVTNRIPEQTVRFIWSAASDPRRTAADAAEIPHITVIPSTARIKPREMLRLSAERHGIPDGELIWSVREPDGGEITSGGEYIAPAETGVYTITASCGEVTGVSLIVVY